ncbi:MAG TPA: adenylyltransferase/cytidyltransferase family protein, partial [Gemmatimonadaceae bacterium]|nr:adenylyltransferase/cytidyltransferase family protein [Gemmatimonadaceae bacterium]
MSPAAQGDHPAPERIGILGGSFDPPHIGHVLLAQDAIEALALDRLLVIPTGTQPLKGAVAAPPLDRLAMVRAAFAGVPRVEVDPVEI